MALFNSTVSIFKNEDIKLNKIINSVKASMAVEGLEASPEALEVGKKYLRDEIGAHEALELIKELHKKGNINDL